MHLSPGVNFGLVWHAEHLIGMSFMPVIGMHGCQSDLPDSELKECDKDQ